MSIQPRKSDVQGNVKVLPYGVIFETLHPEKWINALINMIEITDIVIPEPKFASSYMPKEGRTSFCQTLGKKSRFMINDYNWGIEEDWKDIAQEQTVRANELDRQRAEYKFKYESLIAQLVKAKVVNRSCRQCGSFKIERSSSINFVGGMGHVSNSNEHCPVCGHFEAFGPRW